jgi:hypothetical protein
LRKILSESSRQEIQKKKPIIERGVKKLEESDIDRCLNALKEEGETNKQNLQEARSSG